jgi:hypothetical protein
MIRTAVLFLAITALFSSCEKQDEVKPTGNVDTYYYTSNAESAALTLFIDNADMGELPMIAEKADPTSKTQKATALHIPVLKGTHKVEAKTADGTVISSSEMTFSSRSFSVEGHIGGSGVASHNDVIIVELF